jgi:FkbM family methyltransferase
MTPLGFRLIGNRQMERGEFEKDETAMVKELLKDTDILVNIGANIGYYCCIAASMRKRVLAFEPIALNLKYIIKNVEANGWADLISIAPVALSAAKGVARIYGEGTGASLIKGWANGPETYPTLVRTSTLDEEAAESISGSRCLIIADIEGAEKSMLEGAKRVLAISPKPIWLVEISIGEHQPRGLVINPELLGTFEVFWNSGYESWTSSRPYRSVSREEIENIATGGSDTLKTHNFLFVEKGRSGCWQLQKA